MTNIKQYDEALRRRMTAGMLVFFMVFGIVSAAPSTADAASKGYYSRTCVIPAVYGDGVKGNGCNLWGVPVWVSGSQGPSGLSFDRWIASCGAGAVWAVIGIVKRNPKAVWEGLWLGCATGVAGAEMFGR